jgi:carboxypeptidase Taq
VLDWDQATYMPSGGAESRGRQLATLARIAHERSVDDALGKLLETLSPLTSTPTNTSTDASLVRMARRDYERATKIPPAFTSRLYDHMSKSYNAWTEARPANDFARMQPILEKTLDLSREMASFFPATGHIADPLIDASDPGMSATSVRALFTELRRELVPLVEAIASSKQIDDTCLQGNFPEAVQLAFGEKVVRQLGYDFTRGRQDKTHHPFMTRFALGDVRITTRVNEKDLGDALFGTIHESGHAMYEQGTAKVLDGLPIGQGASAGVHESQSRLWENLVGRSLAFWTHFYPALQEAFPSFRTVPLKTFYAAINKVERSLVRVDADEVTYNLHVMIRFDLELEMLEGKLAVRDLPEAWRARYKADPWCVVTGRQERRASGRALVLIAHWRDVSGLHHWQYFRRASPSPVRSKHSRASRAISLLATSLPCAAGSLSISTSTVAATCRKKS